MPFLYKFLHHRGGSDGFYYHENVSKGDRLHIFNRDLCHSLPMEFHEEVMNPNGIPAYRFRFASDAFDSPKVNPDNACFCNDGNCGTPSGVFNISRCQYGAPTFLSLPHFLNGDPSLHNAFEGLNPDAKKHASYLDVQPVTTHLTDLGN